MTYEQWSRSTPDERAQAQAGRWCLVGYQRLVGWLPGALLSEGGPPDSFRGGGHLTSLVGSEWQLVRYAGDVVAVAAVIGFKTGGTVSGSVSGSRFAGSFVDHHDEVLIDVSRVTDAACGRVPAAAERRFLALLSTASRYVASHLVMALLDDSDRVIAQFRRMDWD